MGKDTQPDPNTKIENDNADSILKQFATTTTDSDRALHSHCMARLCHLFCSKIDIVPSYLEELKESTARIEIFFKRYHRRLLKSRQVKIDGPTLKVNSAFTIQYVHHIKKKVDILQLDLQRKKPNGNKFQTIGTISIDMNYVLQCPMDSVLPVLSKIKKKDTNEREVIAKAHIKVATVPNNNEFVKPSANQLNLAIQQENPYSSSDDSESDTADGSSSGDEIEVHGNTEQKTVIPKEAPKDAEDNQKNKLGNLLQKGLKYLTVKTSRHSMGPGEQNTSDEEHSSPTLKDPFQKSEFNLARQQAGKQTKSSSKEMPKTPTMKTSKSEAILDEVKLMMAMSNENQSESRKSSNRSLTLIDSPKRDSKPLGEIKTIQEHLDALFKNKPKPSDIIFVNVKTRRGKKLGEWLTRKEGVFREATLCTNGSPDVKIAMKSILEAHQSKSFDKYEETTDIIKVMVMGTDSYINDILRAGARQVMDNPKAWKPFRFYIVPIGKAGSCNIAEYLARTNASYHEQFFSEDWKRIFSKKDAMVEEEGKIVEEKALKYLQNASAVTKLDIAEALLTYTQTADKLQEYVPFLRNIVIGNPISNKQTATTEESKQDETTVELKLDYWFPTEPKEQKTKKEEKKKDEKEEKKAPSDQTQTISIENTKKSSKHKYNCVSIWKLPTDSIPEEHHPGNMLTLWTQQRTKNLLKKKTEIQQRFKMVNKVICTVEKKSGTKAVIDGVEFAGVKFMSINPNWVSNLQFCVAQFPGKQGDEGLLSSEKLTEKSTDPDDVSLL